ncbi:BRCT domain-containing At4g02110 [Olea europaea subsp. europaea]|nr:BRCT domain-containing At4g02110 [Olea europaea subsp. europaea]
MEAEAKDSDEETEDMATMKDAERKVGSALNTRSEMKCPYESLVKQEVLRNSLNLSASKSSTNIGNSNEVLSTLGKVNFDQSSFLKESHNKHLEMLVSCSARSPGKMSSDVPSGTRFLEKVENDLASSSRSAKMSPNTVVSKLGENSYSRKTPAEPSLLLFSERIESNAGNTSTSNADELRASSGFNISYWEKHQDGAGFDRVKTPSKRPALHLDWEQTTTLPEKRKMTVLDGSSKSVKMSNDPKMKVGYESFVKRTEGLVSESLVGNSHVLAGHISPVHNSGEETDLDPMKAVDIYRTAVLRARQDCSEKLIQHTCEGLKMRGLSCNLDAKDLCLSRTERSTDEVEMQQSNLQNIERLSSGANVSEVEKINVQVDLDLPKEGHTGPRSKLLGRKMLAKNTSGSRSSISKGDTTKPKGSISLHEVISPNDSARYSIGAVSKEGYEKVARTGKVKMACTDKDGHVYDETEAPEDNEEHKFDVAGDKQRSTGVEAPHSENMRADRGVDVNDIAKRVDGNVKGVKKKDEKSGANDTEVNKAVFGIKTGLSESRPVKDAGERKVTKGKKHSLTKTKIKASLTMENLENPQEDTQKDGSNTKRDEEKTEADDKETISLAIITKGRTLKDANVSDTEVNNSVCDRTTGLGESTLVKDAREIKVTKGKKHSLTKSKTKASLVTKRLESHQEDAQKDGSITKQDEEKTEADDKETISLAVKTMARTLKMDAKAGANENDTEVNNSVCGKKTGLSESRSVEDARERKVTKRKKHSLTKTKTKVSLMTEMLVSYPDDAQKDGSNTKQDVEKTHADDKEIISLTDKTKARPSKKLKRSINVEKEKEPVIVGGQNVSTDKKSSGELTFRSSKKPLKSGMNIADSDLAKGIQIVKGNSEPACFILSGHKLQRKEFRQVLRHLKGRVCRDSHQWSYQATHFIVPDPIRRTEKFFAAAASGSWILKTDYLMASNEAGIFLAEEPYELHKKCLSEDGAINLEAPRKWRLLRERTGHGAFYGMHIIIYGECVAPPLDTLKRVVKAGDGTILATSPPYTRFLKSKVDFAIVSPGIPRIDMWVQEFLRHKIPCVVADYLVEYVCKPGYSLERHVQYNTHAWAEKSVKNLVNCMEEVIEDVRTPENDDLACTVCGSRDQGDEMLICGDDSGSAGCGIGTHIDCCDPPLEDVPEDDWFCTECRKKRESIRKSPRKRAFISKN